MNPRLKPFAAAAVAGLLGTALLLTSQSHRLPKLGNAVVQADLGAAPDFSENTHSISATGYLEPEDRIRILAPPTQLGEVMPTVKKINVAEGQLVEKGQVMAIFDTVDRISGQRQVLTSRISSIRKQIALLDSETSRYRGLAEADVFPKSDLENKELQLLKLKSEFNQLLSEMKLNTTELSYSRLISPIRGRVLKIYTRPGERTLPQGVMEVGATGKMTAVAQINESKASQLRIGKPAWVRSENGSFAGTLSGSISHIAPRIGERKQLTNNPRADSDFEARTIDVIVKISPKDVLRVENLTGAKVIVTLSK